MKIAAIIVAAGQGKRMKSDVAKQYLPLQGKPILYHTLQRFLTTKFCDEIIVVVSSRDYSYCQKSIIDKFNLPVYLVRGGRERQDSVHQGLLALSACDYVIIHDGVRCLVTSDILKRTLVAAQKYGAATAAVQAKDTIKIDRGNGFVKETFPRSKVWLTQTPQIFKYDIIVEAYKRAYQEKFYGTDDAMLVERLGRKVKIVPAEEENIKITTPFDLKVAEMILAQRKKDNLDGRRQSASLADASKKGE